MWAEAFVPSFIEVLPLISAFLMQFKIKEMKGKAARERLYKQDSRGALKGHFVRGFGRLSPRGEAGGSAPGPGEHGLGISRSPSDPRPRPGIPRRGPVPGHGDAGLQGPLLPPGEATLGSPSPPSASGGVVPALRHDKNPHFGLCREPKRLSGHRYRQPQQLSGNNPTSLPPAPSPVAICTCCPSWDAPSPGENPCAAGQ